MGTYRKFDQKTETTYDQTTGLMLCTAYQLFDQNN